MYSIGLDVHGASFTAAGVDETGRLIRCRRHKTTEERLIEEVGQYPSPRQVVVEECHLAQWVKMALEPYVDRLVVCDPKENRWISQEDFIDDQRSAERLAELLRDGRLKEIVHPTGEAAALRREFLHYCDLNCQVTRFKNKLKSVFGRVAVATPGAAVYAPESREAWLAKLPDDTLRHIASHYALPVDLFEAMKRETFRRMTRRASREPAYKLLQTIPGVGPVLATGYVALIVTPHRFSHKNKLWRYAGFGNIRHVSDGVVYASKASPSGCRALKWVAKQHFKTAIRSDLKENRFIRKLAALRANGLSRKQAKRQVCRQLLSVVRAVWMKGEAYRDR